MAIRICSGLLYTQSRQCTKLFLQSSVLESPPPPTARVSTEVRFWLSTEYGIFWKTYGIPRNSAVFFAVKIPGIPSVSAYGIPHVSKWSSFQIPPWIKNKKCWTIVLYFNFQCKKLVIYRRYVHYEPEKSQKIQICEKSIFIPLIPSPPLLPSLSLYPSPNSPPLTIPHPFLS